jgi:hypothetical protein
MIPAFLLSLVPAAERWLAFLLAGLALFGFGFVRGLEHEQAKDQARIAKQATDTVKLARARDVVTTKVETKYLPQITKTEVITETITKEVPTYALPTDPPLPGRFRVFHDAAAQGIVPDPARIADAAPVSTEDADRTIAENYGQCRADQLRLQGLQEWITEQGKVKPPE